MASDFDSFLLGPKAPAQGASPAAPAATAAGAMVNPASVPTTAQDAPAPLGIPALGALGAGVVQGGRDIGQTLANAGSWLDRNVPLSAAIDRATGLDPNAISAALTPQTDAYNQRYGSSGWAGLGRVGSQMLLTAPLTGPLGAAAGTAARALPLARVLAPAIEGAIAGGGTNALVSGGYNENPLTAAATGAIGGGVLGGGLGALAAKGIAGEGQQAAERLGIDLTAGQRMGGFAKGVEDITGLLPFSGAAGKAAEQNQQVARVLGQNMGVGPVDTITRQTLNDAEANAGRLMDQAKNININANTDPVLNDLAMIDHNAEMGGVQPTRNAINHIQNIMANNNGVLPGNELHNLISYRGALDNQIGMGDRAVSGYAQQIKDALLDAAERTTAGNPAFDQFQQGRQYWKAIKTVENSIERTPDGSEGMSLQGLKASIFRKYDMRQGGPGNDMQDLARVIGGPLAELKSSGTGRQNLLARLLIPGGEAAGIGAMAYLNPAYVANTAIPAVASSLAGRAMRYGPGMGPGWGAWRAYRGLTNPLAPRAFGPMVGNALVSGQAPQGAPQ